MIILYFKGDRVGVAIVGGGIVNFLMFVADDKAARRCRLATGDTKQDDGGDGLHFSSL